MNGHPSHRGPSPEALVPGSSPSSLSPNLRHQRCWQTQRVTSLPSWGHWGGGMEGGQEKSLSPGGLPGAGPSCCRGLVRAVHHSAGHPSPFPASLPLDIKGTFPRAKETQNHFLPHLVPPSNLSLSHPSAWPHQHVWGCALSSHQSPQLPSALARVPSWKYSHQ